MKLQIVSNGPYLKYSVNYNTKKTEADKPVELDFRHTCHSFKRASQRGILGDKIIATLEHGESYYKQGLIFYILGEDNIPDNLKKDSKKLQNTVVIMSGDSNQVITCYRSKHAHKHIKMKSRQLNKVHEFRN